MRSNFKIILTFTITLLIGCSQESTENKSEDQLGSDITAQDASSNGLNETTFIQSLPDYLSEDAALFFNATIYTGEKGGGLIEAFAVDQGRIIATGSLSDIEQKLGGIRKVNLDGMTVIPGFIDAHGHLSGLGQSLQNVDLMGTTSKAEIINRLKQRESSLGEGDWLIGRGWDQNDWIEKELPSKADLDAHFPTIPVWLERIDGHASWGNTAAIKFADRNLNGRWQIPGGEIIRDDSDEATGVFIDNAAVLVQKNIPQDSKTKSIQAIELAMRQAARVGLTGMHDAGTSLKDWRLLKELNAEEKLTLRVYAMANGANEMLDHLCEVGHQNMSDLLIARSIKLYSDGALGSRGAALIEEYSDDPGNFGLLIETKDELIAHAKKAMECNLQVNIHAIGDRGNRITLDVLETAMNGVNNPGRHRIEHSQVIHEEDFERFKEMGIIASVQPTHATSDMYWAENRVGNKRIRGAYAWQTLIEHNIPLALGSDFPVEKPDPLHGFYAAITRKDQKNWPAEGWYPEQKLTREQALYGFTLGAAFAAFQEENVGSISTGKFADFVVLSKDIMSVPASQILRTSILHTYVSGKAVYSAPQ